MEIKPQEIYSITEAYSMQPTEIAVGDKVRNYHTQTEAVIKRIVQEDVYITGDPFDYYVGYDEEGNRLFEYRKGTVNVKYKIIGNR